MDKKFLILLLLGLFLRLAYAFLPSFKIDMDAWFAWALRLNQLGLANFYSDKVWTNYTPGYLYILAMFGFLKQLLSISDQTFIYLIKIPAIVSELILGTIIYSKVRKVHGKNIALAAGLSIFLNPALIFNSSVWGQIDGLLSLLMFVSVYYLSQKKLLFSSILFGLSILVKPQTLALTPLYIVFLLKNFSLKRILQIVIPVLLTVIFLSIPFFPTNPLTGIFRLISKMTSDYPATSLFAFNFWGIFGFWMSDKQVFLSLSLQTWGIILIILFWLISLPLLLTYKKINLFLIAGLCTLSFYFLPTRAHERYLYPALPFLIFLTFYYKSKLLGNLTLLLNFLHLLNLYYVYVYYNELFLKLPKVLYIQMFYNFIDLNAKSLSIFSTLTFFSIWIILLKLGKVNDKN